jgi:hypothetical protein
MSPCCILSSCLVVAHSPAIRRNSFGAVQLYRMGQALARALSTQWLLPAGRWHSGHSGGGAPVRQWPGRRTPPERTANRLLLHDYVANTTVGVYCRNSFCPARPVCLGMCSSSHRPPRGCPRAARSGSAAAGPFTALSDRRRRSRSPRPAVQHGRQMRHSFSHYGRVVTLSYASTIHRTPGRLCSQTDHSSDHPLAESLHHPVRRWPAQQCCLWYITRPSLHALSNPPCGPQTDAGHHSVGCGTPAFHPSNATPHPPTLQLTPRVQCNKGHTTHTAVMPLASNSCCRG